MKKRNKILIGMVAAAVVIAAAAAAGLVHWNNVRTYEATYITIGGTEYRRDTISLDLSGKPNPELSKLRELPGLLYLDLRGTGITASEYDRLRAELPGCEIRWSVPFQGGYFEDSTEVLEVTRLSEADISQLSYFPALRQVSASGCPDYAALEHLREARPDLKVSYTVCVGGREYSPRTTKLTVENPDAKELRAKLPYLPNAEIVTLTGVLPKTDVLLELKETFPDVRFVWDFTVCGVPVSSTTEFFDLSGIKLKNTEELESLLPCFYNLKQVDMCGCGISNEEMDALNTRHPDTKFVWTIRMGGQDVRTDIRYFVTFKPRITPTAHESQQLRYCKDLEVLDLGHKRAYDVAFVQYLPKLKCLLLCEGVRADLDAISRCTSLEFLELFATPFTDFWPLTNLTNLRDLNLSATPYSHAAGATSGPFGDLTPLYQMTWLDRLWLTRTKLTRAQRAELRERMPDTTMVFFSTGCTTFGFRYTPLYFWQRDVIGMRYFHN